jgi:hypothetical protein
MKQKKFFWVSGCTLLTGLILISCTTQVSITDSPFTITPSQVLIAITPEITSMTVAPPDPTVIPTLPVVQAKSRLLELMVNNGDCLLPCIWGITPGKSTFGDAQNILMPLSSISSFTDLYPSPGDISFMSVEGDGRLSTRIAFPFSEAGVIEHIVVQIRIISASDEFNKQIAYYILPNILIQYGEPSVVMLSTMARLPSSDVSGGFKVLLLYPDQGVLLNYTMQMQITGESIMGCPSNAHVELELYPPGQADSFSDLLEPSGWAQIIQNTYKPLNEATSMSREDFYRIFSQPTDECILTPANLWPIPD